REVAEEHAERHQGEGDGKAEHDEDDEQGEHQHAQLGIAQAKHQALPFGISGWTWPSAFCCSACSRMTFSSSSTSCRRLVHSPRWMQMAQRITSTTPWITMRQPTITISHLNGHTIGPLGLAEECSFIRRDSSAKL